MWHLTIRNLFSRKMRTITTSLAIAFGVAFIAGSLIFGNTMTRAFDDLFAGVFKNTDTLVRGPMHVEQDQSGFGIREAMDQAVMDKVRSLPNVEEVVGHVEGQARVVGSNGEPLVSQGAPQSADYWNGTGDITFWRLAEGRPPQAPNEIALDRATQKKAKVNVGDDVTVITKNGPSTFKLVGTARVGEVDSPATAQFVLFNSLQTLQEQIGEPGKVASVQVKAKPGVSQKALTDEIQQMLKGSNEPFSKYEAVTGKVAAKETQDALKSFTNLFTYLLLGFAGLSLLVGGFIVYNTFSILLAQRIRESAMLRAIGARRRQIVAASLIEALVVGVVASLIGFALGIGLAAGIRALLAAIGSELPGNGLSIPSYAFGVSLGAGVLVTLLAALYPSIKSSGIPPLAAVRDVAFDHSHRSVRKFVLATVMFVVGIALMVWGANSGISRPAIPVILGVVILFFAIAGYGPFLAVPFARFVGAPLKATLTGKIARENAMRNPSRTATTAAALMIGVAIVVFFTALVSSAKVSFSAEVDKQVASDYMLSSGGDGMMPLPIPDDAVAAVANTEGVGSIILQQMVRGKLNDTTMYAVAVELRDAKNQANRKLSDFADLDVKEGDVDGLTGRQIALSKKVSDKLKAPLGSKVTFVGENGTPIELEVKAIFEKENVLGQYIVPKDVVAEFGYPAATDAMMVKKATGADSTKTLEAIKEAVKPYKIITVQDRTEFKKSLMKQLDGMLQFLYALLALTIIIALFGIANTLALSVFERTRELGLMRAVGMTRRTTRLMVRLESIIVAVLGTLQGLIIGTVFAWVVVTLLKSEGLGTFSIPWGQYVVILTVAVVAGLIAAALPARRAARLNLIKAIAANE